MSDRPNRKQSAEGPEWAVFTDSSSYRSILRQVGWIGQSGDFYALDEAVAASEPGSFRPLWFVVDTDKRESPDVRLGA